MDTNMIGSKKGKKMKRNLLTTKQNLRRLIVCSLVIAVVIQTTGISVVHATSETVPRSNTPPSLPDDTVTVSNGDPMLIAPPQEPMLIVPEEEHPVISTAEVASLIAIEDDEVTADGRPTLPKYGDIKTMIPQDNSQRYDAENVPAGVYYALIAPSPQTGSVSAYLGLAMLMATIGVGTVVFVARKSVKIKA